MRIELTPENLAYLGAVSARIPDTLFKGTSRNTTFLFRAGFIYANGRILKQPKEIFSHQSGNFAESIIFPLSLASIKEILTTYNVGCELELEPNLDLEKELGLHSEKIIA
jgi:hypothetical protein